jgi:hypothetical protein
MSKNRPGYDDIDDMYAVKSMQKKWRESFPGAAVNAANWDVVTGSGMAWAVSGGQLTLTTGTTINVTSSITSKEMFTIPCRLMVSFALSQRIANNTFYLEMVSCDPNTGIVDDQNLISWKLDQTTATQGIYEVKNLSGTVQSSALSTITTTASQAILECEAFADEAWFHSRVLDSVAGRANSYVKHRDIPDPNRTYKARIRAVNGGTAPASTTTLTALFVLVNDYAELTAEITAGRGNMAAGQGIAISYMPGVTGNVTGIPPTPTVFTLNSAATTNATSVKASAGNVFGLAVSNQSAAAKFLKIYNKASAPTVGTDIPILTVPIPVANCVALDLGYEGLRCSTGIALAITNLIADADATAVAVGDVKVWMSYT